MASVDDLEEESQQQHQRFYDLFGTNPTTGQGFTNVSTLGRQLGHQTQEVRSGVIGSNFSTSVIPALATATHSDHQPFTNHATTAATAAHVSDASAQVNLRGAADVLANSRNEAAQFSAIPDRNSPEGMLQALNTISDNQAKSLNTVQQSAAAEQRLGVQAANGHIQATDYRHGPLPQDPPAPPAPAPTIAGPGTPPGKEGLNTGKQDDLDTTIPGTGIALGGDGKDPNDGYPRIHVPGVYDGKNPLPVPPGTRPLPTGTAIGPNGQHYAFYAVVPYNNPDGTPNLNYTSPDTVVVDLAHPDTPLYTLHGISQASGAFDAASGRMIIMGNGADGQRALWQSVPISENSAWGNAPLQSLGTFQGAMNGNRESQIVALPKGGFMAVGAAETPDHLTLPLEGATAANPADLLTAPTTALVTPEALPQVYGPTISDIQVVDGQEIITMRVSTFGDGEYDPHTYTTTFPVNP